MTGQKPNPAQRRKARKLAMQGLYQWHIAEQSITQIEAEFLTDNDMAKVDQAYFSEVLRGVAAEKSELDSHIERHVDRNLSSLTPVELAILRMGAYEFIHRIDVPYKVVINEGIELAKTFGATDGHKYVNGVLDLLAQSLRTAETQAGCVE